jgi:hypothetical protein
MKKSIIVVIIIALLAIGGGLMIRPKNVKNDAHTMTADSQKTAIIEAIDNYCKTSYFKNAFPGQTLSQVYKRTDLKFADWHIKGQENYEKSDYFKQIGKAARMEALCYNDELSQEDNGSGATFVLIERPTGAWLVLSRGQMPGGCEALDGFGIANDLIKCFDQTTHDLRDLR